MIDPELVNHFAGLGDAKADAQAIKQTNDLQQTS